ncbi:MAG: 2-oxo acid dehydrogenase subunit E2 [Spirochaetaceae bacterium]|nr:2-oxo acid dehydrogenase subunit E2 [Myxococcales bacterium]MCB9723682.1 2-oxo acid dehydrogenase subunit E2 [Spirochaetaceae bacterium]
MGFRIEMPQLSSDGGSATLASWLVGVGDRVEQGEVIAELETDKATVELEAPASGRIQALEIAAGTEGLEAGTLLGTIDADEGGATTTSDPVATSSGPPSASPSAEAEAEAEAEPEPSARRETEGTVQRGPTPLARRVASNHGVDLASIEGSGPGGRVLRDDVLRRAGIASGSADPGMETATSSPDERVDAVVGVEPEADFEVVRLSAMRRTIARRLSESKREIPHFYLRVRCRMDALREARAKLNRALADEGRETKISVNDFVVRAAALGMRAVPAANVRFAGDAMHVFERVDVAVAVATDGGLVTPVVRDADRKGLAALADETKALAERARAGGLRPEEYQGGSLTVSNLGMYGIETVYPIVNPPQSCILGVGAAEEQPVVRDGGIAIGWIAVLTLAADHRVIDGAVGARLLAAIRDRLEDPMDMVL